MARRRKTRKPRVPRVWFGMDYPAWQNAVNRYLDALDEWLGHQPGFFTEEQLRATWQAKENADALRRQARHRHWWVSAATTCAATACCALLLAAFGYLGFTRAHPGLSLLLSLLGIPIGYPLEKWAVGRYVQPLRDAADTIEAMSGMDTEP